MKEDHNQKSSIQSKYTSICTVYQIVEISKYFMHICNKNVVSEIFNCRKRKMQFSTDWHSQIENIFSGFHGILLP